MPCPLVADWGAILAMCVLLSPVPRDVSVYTGRAKFREYEDGIYTFSSLICSRRERAFWSLAAAEGGMPER